VAYPFAQAPTVTEFVGAAVKRHGCTLEEIEHMVGPDGPISFQYLTRVHEGHLVISEPLPADPEERLAPDTLRRLCAQLRLKTVQFGYDLDWVPLLEGERLTRH
jgi:hypothetical protein